MAHNINYTYVEFDVNEVGLVVADTDCIWGPMATVVMAFLGYGKNPTVMISNQCSTLGLLTNSLGVFRGCNTVDNGYGKARAFIDFKYRLVYTKGEEPNVSLVVIATDEVVTTAENAGDFHHFGRVNGYVLVDYNPLVHIIRAECKSNYIDVN